MNREPLALTACALSTLLIICCLPDSVFHAFARLGPGNLDLVSFWSAAKLFFSGASAYNDEALYTLQAQVGLASNGEAKITWNPPWFFLLLSPLLLHSLEKCTALMLLTNVSIVLVLAQVVFSPKSGLRVKVLLPALLFYPFLQTLNFGQSSCVLALLTTLTLYGYTRGWNMVGGTALSLLTIKPHLVLGFAVSVVGLAIVQRRWRFLLSAFVSLSLFAAGSFLLSPDSVMTWWGRLQGSGNTGGAAVWITATIAYPLRELFSRGEYPPAPWIISVLLVLNVVFSGLATSFISKRFGLEKGLISALCISLAFAPYGWIFDNALFLLPLMVILREEGSRFLPAFLLLDGALFLLGATVQTQGGFFFVPGLLSVFALYYLFLKKRAAYE